jgi:hypothetical protein
MAHFNSSDTPFDRSEGGSERDPVAKLEKRRAQLESKLEKLQKRTRSEIGDAGFWAVAGGIALAADWLVLGGIGTGLAVLGGATIFNQSRQAKRIVKQITALDEQIAVLELERMRLEAGKPQPAPKVPQPGLTDDFSPAAKKEIEALRARLSEMEKKVAQQQDPTLDKPKFGPRPEQPKK